MKKFLLSIITLLILIPVGNAGIIQGRRDVASSSCQDISQIPSNDYWGVYQNLCQRIEYQAGCSVYTASVELYNDTTDPIDVHIELWPSNDKSGTQIGSDSSTVAVTATSGGTIYTFTWSVPPTPTGIFFLHVVRHTSDTMWARSNTDENSYVDTNYDLWRDGSEISGDHDMAFGIEYQ